MARGYVYLLVKPHASDHPMNNILGGGNYLYEVRHLVKHTGYKPEELEIWRMQAGSIEKKLVPDWFKTTNSRSLPPSE